MDPNKVNKKQKNVEKVITRIKDGSPDMILTPFDGKFNEKKDELPPEAARPQKIWKTKTMGKSGFSKKLKKNNVEKVGPPKVEKKQWVKVDHQKVEIYIYVLGLCT